MIKLTEENEHCKRRKRVEFFVEVQFTLDLDREKNLSISAFNKF